MKAQGWLGAVVIVLIGAIAHGAEETPPRVARLGEPARWTIEGANTFSADEIRAALADNFDIAAACDNETPLDALLAALVAKTTAGYQQAGFPDAKVSAAAERDQIRMTVEEGDRYPQGELRVRGNQTIDGERIRQALTDRDLGKRQAPWRAGDPAWFNPEAQDWLTTRVAELAEEQGFYRAACHVSVKPDREAKKATLDIEFSDEGPRATLGDVEITTGDINPPEKVLAYLKLDAETPLTREVRDQAVRHLFRSGRFLRVGWELGEASQRNESWRPRLVLWEYEQAPPLDAPLTREEAALLKLAEWIERFDDSDEEILLRFPQENVAMILAPRHGYIIEYQPPEEDGAAAAGEESYSALVMAEERVGLYSASQRRKIDAAPPPISLRGNAEVTLIKGGERMNGGGGMQFGAGLWRSSSSPRRHIDIKLKLTAVAALSVVRTHKAKVAWDGDVVCFEWKYREMRVNASTGQLLEQIVHKAIDDEGNADADNSFVPHIKVGAGQFSRRLAEIEKRTADWPNAAEGQRPLSCVSEFLCRELGHFDAESKSAYAAIGKLVSGGLLRPFDELAAQVGRPAEDHFAVPYREFHFPFNSFSDLFALAGELSRIWGVSAGNWLLPGDGWTQAVWRDGVLMLTDDWRDAGIARLWRQIANGRGPISALTAAEMFRAAGSNSFAEYSAGRGLRRLSPEEFRDDCGELLGGRGFVSQCLLQAAAAARQLNSADIQAIADLLERLEVLDASQANIFARCACAFLGGERDTPAQNAADALDALWTVGLSDWVERRLHTLATPPALAEPGPFAAQTYPTTTAGPPFAPAEAEKPVEKEVRELKWLASALTERLTHLEERLATGAQNNAGAVTTMTNETQVTAEPGVNGLPFHLHGPDRLTIVLGWGHPPGPLPMGVLVWRQL